MSKNIVLGILGILIGLSCQAQDLHFFKESITFKIEKDLFHVSGDYYLKSNVTGKKILFYPYPVDELYGEVDTINIYDVGRQELLEPFKESEHGVFLSFMADSTKEAHLKISYSHKLNGEQAEYILLTTQEWGKPFELATYQLIVENNLEVKEFSYTPDKKVEIENETLYFWKKENFMPIRNMIFKFEEKDLSRQ